jgi:MFS family permease
LIWISLSYFFYGGHYSIFPTVTAKLYGPVTGAKIYPIIFSGFAFSTIIGVVLAKVVIPKLADRGAGAYHPIFFIQGALTIVSIVLCYFLDERPQKTLSKADYDNFEDDKEET